MDENCPRVFLARNYFVQEIPPYPKREKPSIAHEMAGGQNSDERVEPHAIIQHMLESGIEEEAAKAFLIKAIQGKVPHLKITY